MENLEPEAGRVADADLALAIRELTIEVRALVAGVETLRASLPAVANSPLAKMLGLKAKVA